MSTSLTARRAAAALVSAVTDDRRSLDDALASTRSFAELEGRDRAFARAIASATLRRLGGVDAILARFLQRPLPEDAIVARALLRTAAGQILAMGSPAYAVVSETVTLARQTKKAMGFANLFNAVLRRVGEAGPAALDALPPGADLPDWLFNRWRAAYGARALDIAQALRAEAPLDVILKPGMVAAFPGAPLLGAWRLPTDAPAVTDLPGFSEGDFWVQDAAAALPARLLGDVAGKIVIDLCAAPGGKTMQLAAAGAVVTAVELEQDRIARLNENLARTGLSAKVVCADARTWRPTAPADMVLLDAPCTATGTLRRRPDAAWLRRPSDIESLSQLQGQLIEAAAAMLKPGGVLVYAVCSLEPEEGPGQIAAALRQGPWARAPLTAGDVYGAADLITTEGDLRTTPADFAEAGGIDGFFAARLIRQ